ncbi:hypothetical protein GCM10010124_36340 [Pilimelia terevasa]|uniref:DUF2157 domain-containing protein n=1 Tax=Pilimelia terevasa TaxID=53372 RepID=A0A8J3BRI3_9ACTN|nr:DUF2157 domain-containing protein [Pilimelia terevasa]GGK40342.1 hypothetical protein GCM10010124_36340 [Pilimelia terevasa]
MTSPPRPDLSALVDRWLADGVLAEAHAARVRADLRAAADAPAEPGQPAPAGGNALVVEGLGYLGGVIVVVALGLLAGSLWADLPVAGRLALLGAATAALVLGGALAPVRHAAGRRLRAVLWLAAAAGTAILLSAAVDDDGLGVDGDVRPLVVTAGAAAGAAALWWFHRSAVQQAAALVGLQATVLAAAALHDGEGPTMAAPWAVGVAWAALAWGRVLPGRRAGMVLGAGTAVAASLFLIDQGGWTGVPLATALGLAVAAVYLRDLVLLGLAAGGALVALPLVVSTYFPGATAAALVLLVVGVLLVGAALFTARRRRSAGPPPPSLLTAGSPAVAAAAAAAVLVPTAVLLLRG